MTGAYCRFCDQRCFVDRVLPDWSWSGHMATCAAGMAHDRETIGYDHTTALNLRATTPPGLSLERLNDPELPFWQIIHTASGTYLPLPDWDRSAAPHSCAKAAVASLATSGIDWTMSSNALHRNRRRLDEALAAASAVAYLGALDNGAIPADHPRPADLETRCAYQRQQHPVDDDADSGAAAHEAPTEVSHG